MYLVWTAEQPSPAAGPGSCWPRPAPAVAAAAAPCCSCRPAHAAGYARMPRGGSAAAAAGLAGSSCPAALPAARPATIWCLHVSMTGRSSNVSMTERNCSQQ